MLRLNNSRVFSIAIPVVLAAASLALLIFSVPSFDVVAAYQVHLLLYAILTGLAVAFAVILTESELSIAHMIGMLAFLALPAEVFSAGLWAVTIGALCVTMVKVVQASREIRSQRWRELSFVLARQTICFYVAGQIYLNVGGILPLKQDTWDFDLTAGLQLGLYCFVYVTLYLACFMLEYMPQNRLRRSDLVSGFIVLLLPLPFAVLGAVIANQLAPTLEVITLIGLAMIILGLYALSRSEYRLRRQLDELRTLSVVTRATRAHLNLETLLKTIYLQVAHLLETNNFTVALFNPERNRLEFPLVIRGGQEENAVDVDTRPAIYHDPLIDHIMKVGSPLLIRRDVAETVQAMGYPPPKEPTSSWLGVPLLVGGRSLGAVVVRGVEPHHHFDQDDLRLLNIVATSAGIAIENAQLYRQQTERAEQLTILNNIAELLSGTLSPNNVLDTVISSASALSQANAVAVYLFMDATAREENDPYIRSAGLSEAYKTLPLLLRNPQVPLHRQLPIAISDIQSDPRAVELRGLLGREEMVALVELPLVRGEHDVGVLVVYFKETQYFSGERLELLRTFATQAAQAIHNARTYAVTDEAFQRSVEQLISLAAIGRMLTSTLDLKTISELVLRHALDALHSTTGAVVLLDQDTRQLNVLAQRGYPEDAFHDQMTIRRSIGWGVAETASAQRIDDVSKLSQYMRLVESTRAQVSTPILRDRDFLGFVTLESNKLAGFSPEDSHFLTQLANQALIAIDNARLFQRITEARDRLQVILDAMEEALILIDRHGKIALANPRIALTGLPPAALVNQSLSELVRQPALRLPERLGFSSAQEILELLEDMQTPNDWDSYPPTLYTLPGDKGELYLQRYIIPVEDEQKKISGALLVFYNKTEEQELDRAREELSRMIVHDLRSPLTAVTTSLKLLREFVPPESDFRSVVESTTDASRRAIRKLLSRVDSLLDISRMESGRLSIDPDVTELATLADNVSVELSPLAHELEIRIVSQLGSDTPMLNIDADKVERLLLNLVDNALKYSPAESDIIIRAHPAGMNGAAPDFVRVDVVDRGPGVPPEYKESLFDRYVQIEGRRKVRRGIGLGLTFCKLVTEAHGGSIWIEDNPGGGSIFAFTLPVARLSRLPEDEDEMPVSSRE
ncbi:MAG: GAF domain-containing protein [bacterium]|nr:GAF domain-containing protein [bacterium]